MADEKKIVKHDILDDVKEAEKKIKRAAFLKMIPKLKTMAAEVNILKKKAELMLEEVGLDEKDIKRVIDFINSLPSVELSDKDIKELKEGVKDDVDESKRKAEKDFEKSLEKMAANEYMYKLADRVDNSLIYGNGSGSTHYYSTAGTTTTSGWGGGGVSATGGAMLASLSMKEADNSVVLNSGTNSVNIKI